MCSSFDFYEDIYTDVSESNKQSGGTKMGQIRNMDKNYNYVGKGIKTGIGATLIGLGTLGGLGNLGEKPIEGLIGASILTGIGSLLIHKDKKKKQSGAGLKKVFDANFEKTIKKLLKHHQIGGAINKQKLKKIIKLHKNTPIHISDIFGDNWKKVGQRLMKTVKEHKGGNIFKDIGKAVKKGYKSATNIRNQAIKKLHQFAQGKTSFKPSTLLNIMSGVVGLTGMASAIIPGVDLISVPVASGLSLGLKSGAHLLKTSGRGYGGALEPSLFVDPSLVSSAAKRLVMTLADSSDYDLNKAALGTIIGLTGLGLTAAYQLYKRIKRNKKAGKGIRLAGSGVSLAGGKIPYGIKYTKTGKIKRDRYSVFYGYYEKTAGGLTASDFMKKGKKIISKKKHEQGLKLNKLMKK